MNERLEWLLSLQKICRDKGQKLSRKKLDELNELLLTELEAHKTLENGTKTWTGNIH